MFKITRDWIHQHSTKKRSWTKNQLSLLNVIWPPTNGWIDKLVGVEIDESVKHKFETINDDRFDLIKSIKANLEIYTDGSWWNKRQGSAAVFSLSGKWFYLTHSELGGTCNRAEVMGAIIALDFLRTHPKLQFESITIYSDSQYLVKTVNDGWRRKKNTDLWAVLDSLIDTKKHNFEWVKGHVGIPGNELADALSNIAQETQTSSGFRLYSGEVLTWSNGSYSL